MIVKPLSKSEKQWIKKAEQLFMDAPERFSFYTIGDADLTIIDRDAAINSSDL